MCSAIICSCLSVEAKPWLKASRNMYCFYPMNICVCRREIQIHNTREVKALTAHVQGDEDVEIDEGR
jgi:hypothetical protein